jgi:hypothetical protein
MCGNTNIPNEDMHFVATLCPVSTSPYFNFQMHMTFNRRPELADQRWQKKNTKEEGKPRRTDHDGGLVS